MICDTHARRIVFAVTILGGYFTLGGVILLIDYYFAHREQNNPLKYLVNKSEIPHLNFTTPSII